MPPAGLLTCWIGFICNIRVTKEVQAVHWVICSMLHSAPTHRFYEKAATKKKSVTLMNRERCWCVDRECPSVIDYI